MTEKYKSIQVKNETYQKLSKMGDLSSSFDQVISNLLNKLCAKQSDGGDGPQHQIVKETMDQLAKRGP